MDDGDPASPLGFLLHEGESLFTKLSNVFKAGLAEDDEEDFTCLTEVLVLRGGAAGVVLILGCTDATQSIFTHEDVDSLAGLVVLVSLGTSLDTMTSSVCLLLGGTAGDVEGSTCIVDDHP